MGPVKYSALPLSIRSFIHRIYHMLTWRHCAVVAPNLEHNISLGQYVKAYPDARVIGPAALVKKRPDIKVCVSFTIH